MKKFFSLALAAMMAASLVGCSSGVSQEEYDAVVAERDALKEQLEEITQQPESVPVETEEPSQVEESQKESTPSEQYTSGQYKVGVDIPAGEYVVLADEDSGYFSVSSDANNDDIIFNGNFAFNSIITVQDGEYLKLSRSTAVPADLFYAENMVDLSKTGIMLCIGKDIEAGEYKLTCEEGESRYYCIYNSSRQDEIVNNENFENSAYVSVANGQYLVLSRCFIEK